MPGSRLRICTTPDAKGEASVPDIRPARRKGNAILRRRRLARRELADPYLLFFWNSNVRSTAIVLNSLARALPPTDAAQVAPLRSMVRWLMSVRKDGRWGNTQENAHAMQALVTYYRKFESDAPDFRAVVRLGEQELVRDEFSGRSTESTTKQIPMPRFRGGKRGGSRPLTFRRRAPARYSSRRACATPPTPSFRMGSMPGSTSSGATNRSSKPAPGRLPRPTPRAISSA